MSVGLNLYAVIPLMFQKFYDALGAYVDRLWLRPDDVAEPSDVHADYVSVEYFVHSADRALRYAALPCLHAESSLPVLPSTLVFLI